MGTGQLGVRDNAAAGITAMRLKEFSSSQVQAWVAGGLAFGWPGVAEEQRRGCWQEGGVLRALALGAGWERMEGKAKKGLLDGEKLASPGADL